LELGRLPDRHAGFDRVAHAIGTLYQQHAETIEQTLIEAYRIPAEATGIAGSCVPGMLTLLAVRPMLTVTAQCDGARELWGLITEHLAAVTERRLISVLIDLWHPLEKLARPRANTATRPARQRRKSHLNHLGGGAKIAAAIASGDQDGVAIGGRSSCMRP
jgi:hypothetical protein